MSTEPLRRSIIHTYRRVFARRRFHAFNRILFDCSLRGLGFLNHESGKLSGESHFLRRLLAGRNNCVVFDVGANVGDYSRKVLEVNPGSTVHAFEPHPLTFGKLRQNVRAPGFHAYNLAVGNEHGELTLYDRADRDGSTHASLYKDVIESIHKVRSVEHPVDVIPLHAFLQEHSVERIDLLKIDTEGNELNVLKGLKQHLEDGRVGNIHFEFNEMNVSSRTFFRDFWELLPRYDLFRMLPDGLSRISHYVPAACEIFAYQNIVASLKGQTEWQ